MQRLQFHQLRVHRGGRGVVAHLIIDVAQRGVERGIALPGFDGLAQHLGGAFQLAFEMQGNGFGKRPVGALELFGFLDGSHGRRQGFGARVVLVTTCIVRSSRISKSWPAGGPCARILRFPRRPASHPRGGQRRLRGCGARREFRRATDRRYWFPIRWRDRRKPVPASPDSW